MAAESGNSSIAQALTSLAGALSPLISSVQPVQQSLGTPTQHSAVPPGPSNSNGSSDRRALQILPSYLRRSANRGGNNPKRAKTIRKWDRDIVCLPQSRHNSSSQGESTISYPHGRYRAELGRMGLIGKLHLTSEMDEEEVHKEIRSVFRGPMGDNPLFPFVFLQSAGEGSKTLVIPALSSSYKWTAQQVARLGGQKSTIYILAQADMPSLKDSICDAIGSGEEDDLETLDGQPTNSESPELPPLQSTPSTSAIPPQCDPYSEYVDLIDLTNDDSDSSDGSLGLVPTAEESHQSAPRGVDLVKVKHLLIQHQLSVLTGKEEEEYQRFSVRRSCLFKDALRHFSKLSFDVSKLLRITFIGEEAVDEGGPRREFFRLLIREVFEKSGLFAGYPCHVIPLHNVEAVERMKFYTIGKMITTCIIQGGGAPACFAKAVADHIIFGFMNNPVCIEDIPDFTIRTTLKEIKAAGTDDELQSIIMNCDFDFIYTCGYTKAPSQIKCKDKEQVIKSVWLHYVHYHPHVELEQLKKGIRDTLGMDMLMLTHPDDMWGLLASSNAFELTPDYLTDSFVIHYSDNGSNSRTKEEAIIFSWFEYISDSKDRKDVSLSHILEFLTGAERVPAAGFQSDLNIYFANEVDRLPWVSTCDLSITFPRNMGLLAEEDFKEKLDLCILGSAGFGKV